MNEYTVPGGHAWAVGTQDTATHNAQKIIERMNERVCLMVFFSI